MSYPNEIQFGPRLAAERVTLSAMAHIWNVYVGNKRIGQVVLTHSKSPAGWVVLNIYCHVKGVMRLFVPILAEYYGCLMSSGVIGGETHPDAQRMWERLEAAVCNGEHGLYFQLKSLGSAHPRAA